MAATFKWYGNGLLKALTGSIDFDTDTFGVMLCTSTYVPNQDTHVFRSDVTNEVAASGTYTSGGVSIGTGAVTYDAASNEVRISFTDQAFTGATITARTVVIYKRRGGAATADELVAYATEAADVSSTAATFTVDFPAPTLTVAAA
jgi:hypothetical protein